MKCPECKKKMPKNAEFCPECAHQLTAEEKKSGSKKKKVLWFILAPILALFLGFAVLVFIVGFVSPAYELIEVDVTSSEIDFGDTIPISITIEGNGMAKDTFEIPVYIDEELVHTFVIEYEGGKIGEIVPITESVVLTNDVSNEAGQHKVAAETLSDTFTVLTAPLFTFRSDVEDYYFVTDYDFYLDYIIANTGETAGECVYSISFDGTVIEENEAWISGSSEETYSVVVNAATAGTHELVINGKSYWLDFYAAESQKTGKLMTNTVTGYSKIKIENKTSGDFTVFLVESDNSAVAVAAAYVEVGDDYTIINVPHGDYYLIFQEGDYYIPQLHTFYFNCMSLVDNLYMEANVVGGAGFYTVWTYEITQEIWDEYSYELDYTPEIPE